MTSRSKGNDIPEKPTTPLPNGGANAAIRSLAPSRIGVSRLCALSRLALVVLGSSMDFMKGGRMTPRNMVCAFALTAGLIALPGSASAQTRHGLWFGMGGGYGSADATCDDCGSGQRENSGAAYLKGGYTINPHLLIGGEFGAWAKNYRFAEFEGNSTLTMYHVSGIATYYPQRTGGLFVKGGAGLALLNSQVKISNSSISTDMGKGPSFIIGGGYDIPVGRIALTPAVNYWYGRLGTVKMLGETFATNWHQNVLDVTFGVTFP
jgi:outer membrane protein with beta-barrel domain